MQANKVTGEYKGGCEVVILRWEGEDEGDLRNRTFLTSVFEHLKYKVHVERLQDYQPVVANPGEPDYYAWFKNWLKEHGTPGKLIIVCYVGHGGISKLGRSLIISDEDTDDEYKEKEENLDISEFQGIACYECPADVLFILETCHAGFKGAHAGIRYRLQGPTPNDHTVMTFAACGENDICYVGSESSDFSHVLGAALVDETAPEKKRVWDWHKTVKATFDKAELIVHWGDESASIPLKPAKGTQPKE